MVTRGTFYLVVLEFPSEDEKDENLPWLQSLRIKIEEFCDEHSAKIGSLRILPKPYFPLVEGFIRKVKGEYQKRGYDLAFRFLRITLRGMEYRDLQRLILEQIQSGLESLLLYFEGNPLDERCMIDAAREVAKANEWILIFQLNRYFPEEIMKLYDLINILSERISEFKVKASEVKVIEL